MLGNYSDLLDERKLKNIVLHNKSDSLIHTDAQKKHAFVGLNLLFKKQ